MDIDSFSEYVKIKKLTEFYQSNSKATAIRMDDNPFPRENQIISFYLVLSPSAKVKEIFEISWGKFNRLVEVSYPDGKTREYAVSDEGSRELGRVKDLKGILV